MQLRSLAERHTDCLADIVSTEWLGAAKSEQFGVVVKGVIVANIEAESRVLEQ